MLYRIWRLRSWLHDCSIYNISWGTVFGWGLESLCRTTTCMLQRIAVAMQWGSTAAVLGIYRDRTHQWFWQCIYTLTPEWLVACAKTVLPVFSFVYVYNTTLYNYNENVHKKDLSSYDRLLHPHASTVVTTQAGCTCMQVSHTHMHIYGCGHAK